ncbi:hypothetical protein DFS33DRAFT_545833 [Desarmillaria ectypa]|nr:hypothetical protein DFS33DRAFT_545833 [Desarmillaria ectypa]
MPDRNHVHNVLGATPEPASCSFRSPECIDTQAYASGLNSSVSSRGTTHGKYTNFSSCMSNANMVFSSMQLYSWQDYTLGIPPETITEQPEIEYGPRFRTVCFRGVPANCSVTSLLDEIKFGPIERVTAEDDRILLQFFNTRAASRCVKELQKRLRYGMICEMDPFISPPLLATTVAHLGLHNASRAVNVCYDIYHRRNKDPPTEELCKEALSAYGDIESVQFVEKTRIGGSSHGLVFRYLDIESSIKALAALRKGLPGFEGGSSSSAYVQDSSTYWLPEWYTPTRGQNRPSTVVLSDVHDMAPVMPAIRKVLRKLGSPAKAYGTFTLNNSFKQNSWASTRN